MVHFGLCPKLSRSLVFALRRLVLFPCAHSLPRGKNIQHWPSLLVLRNGLLRSINLVANTLVMRSLLVDKIQMVNGNRLALRHTRQISISTLLAPSPLSPLPMLSRRLSLVPLRYLRRIVSKRAHVSSVFQLRPMLLRILINPTRSRKLQTRGGFLI